MEILQNIGESITEAFSKAIEAHIAVALVKDYSFSILDKAKKSCKVRMMVGVNIKASDRKLSILSLSNRNNTTR